MSYYFSKGYLLGYRSIAETKEKTMEEKVLEVVTKLEKLNLNKLSKEKRQECSKRFDTQAHEILRSCGFHHLAWSHLRTMRMAIWRLEHGVFHNALSNLQRLFQEGTLEDKEIKLSFFVK
jgi:hypothetical protein